MEYMTLAEIRANAAEIRTAFEELMSKPSLAPKKHAAQWRYFRHCLERTLGAPAKPHDWRALQITQYKFEVEDKLRRLYLSGGAPLTFIFRLFSHRDAHRDQLIEDDDYPDIGGYYVLVRDRRKSPDIGPLTISTLRDHLEMVVTACIDAEFSAYQALPDIDEAKLLRWFWEDGPAYRDVIHTLKRTAERTWTLSNSGNPSTKRVISVRVKEILDGKAEVKTTEYLYLRWWSPIEGKYRYPYRETSRNTYYLIQVGDAWLVEDHILPPPISSTRHRQ